MDSDIEVDVDSDPGCVSDDKIEILDISELYPPLTHSMLIPLIRTLLLHIFYTHLQTLTCMPHFLHTSTLIYAIIHKHFRFYSQTPFSYILKEWEDRNTLLYLATNVL